MDELLNRSVYAGYVDAPKWDISLREGKHEPLISFETYQKIQKRQQEKAKVPARKNLSQDFPLRGFVTCGDCGTPFTACWSKGRSIAYPYYLCQSKGCASYGKSVARDKLENQVGEMIKKCE